MEPFLTITEGSDLLTRRALSPLEWTDALLARIEALDAQTNAFITVTAELARDRARQAANEARTGALHGVPLALKDIIDNAGVRTTGHSRLMEHRIPTVDATAAARLRAAGAVPMGKLATHEFAHGGPSLDLPWPPARNPWDPACFAGSSSSGSGAAVAAGFVPGALGTDTGGSIRIPAAMCRIVGLKPTYGLVSRAGIIPLSPSLDSYGPMARSCEDCAILLGAIAGYDPADPSSADIAVPDYRAGLGRPLRGLRIGVIRHFWERDIRATTEVAAALEAALTVLRGLGMTLHDIKLPSLLNYNDVPVIVQEPEAFAIHQDQLQRDPGQYGIDFLGRILGAVVLSGSDHVQAQRERRRIVDGMLAVLRDVDVLVTLGPGPAPRFDMPNRFGFIHGLWGSPNVSSPFSVTGVPALAVPIGFAASGQPLSMQVAGRPFEDGLVLAVGHAYEQETAWHSTHPRLVPGAVQPAIRLAEPATPSTPDAKTMAFVDACLSRAGLSLSEAQPAMVYQSAPLALATAARIRRDHDWAQEPANVFRLPLSKD